MKKFENWSIFDESYDKVFSTHTVSQCSFYPFNNHFHSQKSSHLTSFPIPKLRVYPQNPTEPLPKHVVTRLKLNPFAHSWFYNATAMRGAFWWLRQSHSVNYANHQHSPFARWRHDFRQAAARRFKLHFSRYRLVKVSWKSVQPFPRTVVSYFLVDGKKTKKNICKTYTASSAVA